MNCKTFGERLHEYELGALSQAERAAATHHLAHCRACRERLARARAADDTIRAALIWAQPSADFPRRVHIPHRPHRLRLAAAVLTAAALVCLALLLRPAAPGPGDATLLAGTLHDTLGRAAPAIAAGQHYRASDDAVIRSPEGDVLLLAAGTRFVYRPPSKGDALALSVFSGSVLVQAAPRQPLAVSLDGVLARSNGGEFFGRCLSLERQSSAWSLLPQAFADASGQVFLYAIGGPLRVESCGQQRTLAGGDSCLVVSGVELKLRSELTALLRSLPETPLGHVAGVRDRLRYLCGVYARRLQELEAAPPNGPVSYRDERIAVVMSLLQAHHRALDRLGVVESQLLRREAIEAELDHIRELEEEADTTLKGLLELLSPTPQRQTNLGTPGQARHKTGADS